MLDKTLDVLRACRDLSAKRLAELKLSEADTKIANREIKYFEDLVKKLEKRIAYLEKKKCTEFSLIRLGWFKILNFRKC